MQNIKTITNIKRFVGSAALGALFVLVSGLIACASDDVQAPELPEACSSIRVEEGNKAYIRTYAIGVQIYRWDGNAWVFQAPSANLYADAGFNGKIGFHYGGPRWESNSGSAVQAARVPGTGCSPDPTAIPWLLLKTVTADGPGIFSRVTFIQRVATSGGLAPTLPGLYVGEEKRIPYTAEYYFYRARN
jgi:hypothetical protein